MPFLWGYIFYIGFNYSPPWQCLRVYSYIICSVCPSVCERSKVTGTAHQSLQYEQQFGVGIGHEYISDKYDRLYVRQYLMVREL